MNFRVYVLKNPTFSQSIQIFSIIYEGGDSNSRPFWSRINILTS